MKKRRIQRTLKGVDSDGEDQFKKAAQKVIDEIRKDKYLLESIQIIVRDDKDSEQVFREKTRLEYVLWYHAVGSALSSLQSRLPKVDSVYSSYEPEDKRELYDTISVIIKELEHTKSVLERIH